MVFSKKFLTIVLIVTAAAVVVYFVFFNTGADQSQSDSSGDSSETAEKPKETPLPVKVATSKIDDLIIKLKSPGEAVTSMKITVKAEISGIVTHLNIEESQHVKKGELLVTVDEESYKLDVQKLEAERLRVLSELLLEKRFDETGVPKLSGKTSGLAALKAEYEKDRQLFLAGKITQAEFGKTGRKYEYALIESGGKKDEIMAATKRLTQTEIDLKKARIELDKTKIRAPFDGIITNIKISSQEHISNSQELFTLVNISRIQVYAKVLESEIGKMKVGREVDLEFSAYPRRVFKGKVKAISPIINPNDKTCNVIIDVSNPDEEIKPGMHAEVEIVAEIYKDRMLIPQDAVLSRSGRKLAFVVVDDVAKWRYIEIGLENEEYAEVLDGIKEGELVLIDGHLTLAHDARVKIIQ
ncbi:MAG: efflux RND transporter periplasmic adaptor subunit [Candidatus Aminicenantes bacterium]|nr:efflux RND transporter periplasmic adaptor subunit [Candidatus Aminicenantes bacterium]